MEFWLNGTLDGTYTVAEDPTAIPETEEAAVLGGPENHTGIEIRKGDDVWFRGAYPTYYSYYWLLDENGRSDGSDFAVIVGGLAPVPDPFPTPKNILSFARGPEISPRGHLDFLLWGLLLSAICIASLLFEDRLFRWNLFFLIKDPDRAEPSEWEMFSRWVSWVALTGAALLAYALGSGLILVS